MSNNKNEIEERVAVGGEDSDEKDSGSGMKKNENEKKAGRPDYDR